MFFRIINKSIYYCVNQEVNPFELWSFLLKEEYIDRVSEGLTHIRTPLENEPVVSAGVGEAYKTERNIVMESKSSYVCREHDDKSLQLPTWPPDTDQDLECYFLPTPLEPFPSLL